MNIRLEESVKTSSYVQLLVLHKTYSIIDIYQIHKNILYHVPGLYLCSLLWILHVLLILFVIKILLRTIYGIYI